MTPLLFLEFFLKYKDNIFRHILLVIGTKAHQKILYRCDEVSPILEQRLKHQVLIKLPIKTNYHKHSINTASRLFSLSSKLVTTIVTTIEGKHTKFDRKNTFTEKFPIWRHGSCVNASHKVVDAKIFLV